MTLPTTSPFPFLPPSPTSLLPSSTGGTSGTQQGPVGTSELQRRYASGELTDAAIAWNPRMPEWKQIGELAELQTAHPRNTGRRRAHRVAPMEPEQVDLGS